MEHDILLMLKQMEPHRSNFDSAVQDNSSFLPSFCMPPRSGLNEIAVTFEDFKMTPSERFSSTVFCRISRVVKCYWAYQPLIEYGTVCRNPVCRIRQIVSRIRQIRFRQTGFHQTGHIPLNMGQFAEFGKLSLPCPVCRKNKLANCPSNSANWVPARDINTNTNTNTNTKTSILGLQYQYQYQYQYRANPQYQYQYQTFSILQFHF